MSGFTFGNSKEVGLKTIRSKSSTINDLRSTLPPNLSKSTIPKSCQNESFCQTELVFLLKKQHRAGVFDFLIQGSSDNYLGRNNTIFDAEKEAIRKRANTANPIRKFKNLRSTSI